MRIRINNYTYTQNRLQHLERRTHKWLIESTNVLELIPNVKTRDGVDCNEFYIIDYEFMNAKTELYKLVATFVHKDYKDNVPGVLSSRYEKEKRNRRYEYYHPLPDITKAFNNTTTINIRDYKR